MIREIRLILGDQLNASHSWYEQIDTHVLFVMAELPQELKYVRHHQQKILAYFAAMRAFAESLKEAGHTVQYWTLDDTVQFTSLTHWLESVIHDTKAIEFTYQSPDEYRLFAQMQALPATLPCTVSEVDSEHFLTPKDAWEKYPNSRLEFFYRALRKQYRVLLDGQGQPEGGRWNFDAENRKRLPKTQDWPMPLSFGNDVRALKALLKKHQIDHIGQAPDALLWPVTRAQSKQLLQFFLHHCLPNFGRYQDALTHRDWSLYHSRLSFALNSKMLHPLEVIQAAEDHWRDNQNNISVAQIEGFIRQILGWREYVRAIYWQHMPEYAQRNALQADRPLPQWYWTGQTQMACLGHAIEQSLEYAYAHHIQRLMITGNFALIAGLHPDAVDRWYLGIYIDAIEWVEMPNTRGMSLFADGGVIASKPYAASGQYVQRMGDYCSGCQYDVKRNHGEGSCPLNSLYWDFVVRHQARFANNMRMKLVYANWARKTAEEQTHIRATAATYLAQIETL